MGSGNYGGGAFRKLWRLRESTRSAGRRQAAAAGGDPFWIVVDPTPSSVLVDILYECSIRNLERQFRGGLSIDRRPAIYLD